MLTDMKSWYMLIEEYGDSVKYDDIDFEDGGNPLCQLIELGITSYCTDDWTDYYQLAVF